MIRANLLKTLIVAAVAGFSFLVVWIELGAASELGASVLVGISICLAIFVAYVLLAGLMGDGAIKVAAPSIRQPAAPAPPFQSVSLFSQNEFGEKFCDDIKQVQHSLVIFSAFVTPARVSSYETLFRRKISSGVRIRCVTRPPQFNGTIPPQRGKEALDALEAMGVAVDCRKNIHQKLAICDGRIIWSGSLNILSYASGSNETMRRENNPELARHFARELALRGDKPLLGFVRGENPRCPRCGNRTYYELARGRAFFACEAECGWRENARRFIGAANPAFTRSRSRAENDLPAVAIVEPLPDSVPFCPKCQSKMVRRNGPRGPFYGCSQFPKCRGTVDAFHYRKSLERA